MSADYSAHLQLPTLLNLQKPLSSPSNNDEVFFIIIHQIHELLFKAILHEIDNIKVNFCENNIFAAVGKWKRCNYLVQTSLSQFDTLETMTPEAFNQFRKNLGDASGFQSYQFREIEFALGYKRAKFLEFYDLNSAGYNALKARLSSPSLIDYFNILLSKNAECLSDKLLKRDPYLANIPDSDVQKAILSLYIKRIDFRFLFESMIDFDISFSEWRFRHWKTVGRIIGSKKGTGGTIEQQRNNNSSQPIFFTDLWAVRDKL